MQVIQLVGRYAGHLLEMPYAEATACISTGTAFKPGEKNPMRGAWLSDEAKAAIEAAGGDVEPVQVVEPVSDEKPEDEPAPESDPVSGEEPERAHEDDGTLKADDPETPGVNEAWKGGETPAKKSKRGRPKKGA